MVWCRMMRPYEVRSLTQIEDFEVLVQPFYRWALLCGGVKFQHLFLAVVWLPDTT